MRSQPDLEMNNNRRVWKNSLIRFEKLFCGNSQLQESFPSVLACDVIYT